MARASHRPRRSSPLNLPGAFELFKPSKDLVIKNIWIFGPLYSIPLLFSLHSWIWSPVPSAGRHWTDHFDSFSSGWSFAPTANYAFAAFVGFSILWFLFVIAAGTIVQVMSQAAQLDAVYREPLDFTHLWRTARELWLRMLGLYIVSALAIVFSLFIFTRRYFLAPYVMLDKKCGIFEAMQRSSAMSQPYAGSVWGVIGVVILIGFIGIVPFVGSLAAFIVGSFYSVAPALRYQQLKRLN